MARKPAEFDSIPALIERLCPFGPYRAVVKHVGDGDTLDVFVDAGLYHYPYVTLRLKDVWSPDGEETDRLLRARLLDLCPIGSHVAVVTEVGPRSGDEITTFTRFVATVILPDGRCLNDELNAYHVELLEAREE